MQIGVFTSLWGNSSFEEALDNAKDFGLSSVEIGAGGFPGQPHCPVDSLIESKTMRDEWLGTIHEKGLVLSALSVHNNPIHPDKSIAKQADGIIRDAIQLASLLDVPTVNGFSGLPGGSNNDSTPNWVTCAWPPHFQDILEYQWKEVAIPYWTTINSLLEEFGVTFGIEMHPGMLVYNVESMLRIREEAGANIGCNFDPSHLWWNGVDPVQAIRKLNEIIVHVHGKDVFLDETNSKINGFNDHRPYAEIANRAWTFRSIGYGHDLKSWKDIMSTLRLIGYDYVVSIEHEDPLMSSDESLSKAISILKQAAIIKDAGSMFWV